MFFAISIVFAKERDVISPPSFYICDYVSEVLIFQFILLLI
ncbi:hypothetical protein NT01EI_2200 [Edwardsiella ictaluri 93-146]|uniref:Uncharacterized protein n=1 Tax=Edwardsiella ictaluri (strain 93-146) TaxID=634503 RepID=C5BFU8_EDWI9|nr:hypothetical protein NT01EI_2200 [Edwardsiella ictaluri 93-146]